MCFVNSMHTTSHTSLVERNYEEINECYLPSRLPNNVVEIAHDDSAVRVVIDISARMSSVIL